MDLDREMGGNGVKPLSDCRWAKDNGHCVTTFNSNNVLFSIFVCSHQAHHCGAFIHTAYIRSITVPTDSTSLHEKREVRGRVDNNHISLKNRQIARVHPGKKCDCTLRHSLLKLAILSFITTYFFTTNLCLTVLTKT